jgi:spore coat protein U-like protein
MLSNNSNNVNNRKFYLINKKKTVNYSTFYVKKEVIDGTEDEGPFAIKVKCTNGREYNFSLKNNEISYFEYPSNDAMDCSISEKLTSSQEAIYMKRS